VPVAGVAVELDERAGIEQLLDPLAREQLSLRALALDRRLAALVTGLLAQPHELVELRLRRLVRGRHRAEPRRFRVPLYNFTRRREWRPIGTWKGPGSRTATAMQAALATSTRTRLMATVRESSP